MTCHVYLSKEKCGSIFPQGKGAFSFKYDDGFLSKKGSIALSQSLPLKDEEFTPDQCYGFFEGLLPEGQRRSELAMSLHVSSGNIYELLRKVGGDCAGAIQIIDPESPTPNKVKVSNEYLNEEEIFNCLTRYDFSDKKGYRRLSLAGAQDKCPMIVHEDNNQYKYILPHHDSPSTHILKIGSDRFPNLVENEAYLLLLANKLNLTSLFPKIDFQYKTPILILERYDRILKKTKIERIHQEDFAQALGLSSIEKYNSEGGPGAKELFSIIRKTSMPGPNLIKMLEYIIFQILIGNDDGHAKNYSLLYIDNKTILAPLYDTVCTRIYDLERILQPSIGGETRLDFLEKKHINSFIKDIGFSESIAKKQILKFIDQFHETVKSNPEKDFSFNSNLIKRMKGIFEVQTNFLLNAI